MFPATGRAHLDLPMDLSTRSTAPSLLWLRASAFALSVLGLAAAKAGLLAALPW